MMKKSNEIFASANFPVIVATLKDSKEDIKVRSFTCKDSGISVISNYMAQPYSPVTGGKLVPQNKKLLTLTASEVDQLESLGTCPNCGAELRAHASVANSLNDTAFHCVVCGEELTVEETGDPEGFIEKLAENFEDADAKSVVEEPQITQMVEQAEVDEEGETTQMVDETTEETETEVPSEPETTQMEVEAESEEEPAEEVESEETVEETEEEVKEEQPVEEETKEEEIRVDMLSRCTAGLNTKKIEIVSSGKDTFHYIMVANKPVATLHKSRASAEVRDIFGNRPLLTQVLCAAIEKEGINKTVISSFGLVPMILKIKASEAIQQALDEKLEEQTTQMQLKEDAIDEEYQQSLGIAAVAVNKNLLEDTKNVLAEDLIENLEHIGLVDAREIVESSFKNYGEEYLRTIVAKAMEFKSKSSEVRNELANTVMASKFKSGKLDLNHKAVASVKADQPLNEEDVVKYRNLFGKK